MITTFGGQSLTQKPFRAVEVWRPQSILKRTQKGVASEVKKPCLWKWAILSDQRHPIGFVCLSTYSQFHDTGIRYFGPSVSLFIRQIYRASGYETEVIEGLVGWVKYNNLYPVVHAQHYRDDTRSAQQFQATDFLYTGCKSYDVKTSCNDPKCVLHMIRIL
jgi:hypothetical protein